MSRCAVSLQVTCYAQMFMTPCADIQQLIFIHRCYCLLNVYTYVYVRLVKIDMRNFPFHVVIHNYNQSWDQSDGGRTQFYKDFNTLIDFSSLIRTKIIAVLQLFYMEYDNVKFICRTFPVSVCILAIYVCNLTKEILKFLELSTISDLSCKNFPNSFNTAKVL